MSQQTYAVIGLGAMGMGLAQSLLRAGLKTVGCDVSPPALAAFAEAGGQTSADPAAAAAMADVLFQWWSTPPRWRTCFSVMARPRRR